MVSFTKITISNIILLLSTLLGVHSRLMAGDIFKVITNEMLLLGETPNKLPIGLIHDLAYIKTAYERQHKDPKLYSSLLKNVDEGSEAYFGLDFNFSLSLIGLKIPFMFQATRFEKRENGKNFVFYIFDGSIKDGNFLMNNLAFPMRVKNSVNVHTGFFYQYQMFKKAKSTKTGRTIIEAIKIDQSNPDTQLVLLGHSLGGVVTQLIALLDLPKSQNVLLFSSSTPAFASGRETVDFYNEYLENRSFIYFDHRDVIPGIIHKPGFFKFTGIVYELYNSLHEGLSGMLMADTRKEDSLDMIQNGNWNFFEIGNHFHDRGLVWEDVKSNMKKLPEQKYYTNLRVPKSWVRLAVGEGYQLKKGGIWTDRLTLQCNLKQPGDVFGLVPLPGSSKYFILDHEKNFLSTSKNSRGYVYFDKRARASRSHIFEMVKLKSDRFAIQTIKGKSIQLGRSIFSRFKSCFFKKRVQSELDFRFVPVEF